LASGVSQVTIGASSLWQGHVHGVVRSDVLAQFPSASQEIEMGVPVEIEVGEICNRFGRAVR
jgi:hypothetical protein